MKKFLSLLLSLCLLLGTLPLQVSAFAGHFLPAEGGVKPGTVASGCLTGKTRSCIRSLPKWGGP